MKGFLTFKFGPMILLNLVLSPLLLAKSRKLNLVVEGILYVPALLVMASLYFLFNIWYSILTLTRTCSNRKEISSRRERLLQSFKKKRRFCSCFKRGFCCPFTMVVDLIRFLKDAISSPKRYSLPEN